MTTSFVIEERESPVPVEISVCVVFSALSATLPRAALRVSISCSNFCFSSIRVLIPREDICASSRSDKTSCLHWSSFCAMSDNSFSRDWATWDILERLSLSEKLRALRVVI